ncbi:U6 snRNA-associated Sm-like protein LSm2 [Teratosphaeriaceae sp. CCFEE 6253]|nr:U6 snRNA-associated Sm-like protein LSm2 [Teratosphaeriaceae sp. CCFEE 6253]
MLFFSFFKTLVNHEVTVELKNDISIRGTLKSVDQYLNIKLDDISVVEELKYPHLEAMFGRKTAAAAHKTRCLRSKFLSGRRRGTKAQYGAQQEHEAAHEELADGSVSQSSVKNVFIRGSVVRYVHLPAAAVDTPLLEDATRRGTRATRQPSDTAWADLLCDGQRHHRP